MKAIFNLIPITGIMTGDTILTLSPAPVLREVTRAGMYYIESADIHYIEVCTSDGARFTNQNRSYKFWVMVEEEEKK